MAASGGSGLFRPYKRSQHHFKQTAEFRLFLRAHLRDSLGRVLNGIIVELFITGRRERIPRIRSFSRIVGNDYALAYQRRQCAVDGDKRLGKIGRNLLSCATIPLMLFEVSKDCLSHSSAQYFQH